MNDTAYKNDHLKRKTGKVSNAIQNPKIRPQTKEKRLVSKKMGKEALGTDSTGQQQKKKKEARTVNLMDLNCKFP